MCAFSENNGKTILLSQKRCIFARKKTIKRTQYEETFLIHDVAGAANFG